MEQSQTRLTEIFPGASRQSLPRRPPGLTLSLEGGEHEEEFADLMTALKRLGMKGKAREAIISLLASLARRNLMRPSNRLFDVKENVVVLGCGWAGY